MHLLPLRTAIVCAWILVVAAIGVLLPVVTTSGWITLVAVGLVPSIFVLRAWKRPSQTMSEEIQEALRR